MHYIDNIFGIIVPFVTSSSLHAMAAMVTTSPATLQPSSSSSSSSCNKHASRGMARCCPAPPPPLLSWPKKRSRGQRQVTSTARATAASSRGPPQPQPMVAAGGEDGGDSIRRLQNGPDVRGVALEGEKGRPVDLTPAAVEAIAESFGEWLREELQAEPQQPLRVSVGRDPRLSGPLLGAALFAGLARAGCSVFDMGLATTPACFMSTILPRFNYDASIMMTASHLPYTRNGLKFFTKRGGLTSGNVETICDRAAQKYVAQKTRGSTPPPVVMRVDLMSSYAEHLREIIKQRVAHPEHHDTPLRGFKVVVNAGNGCGGFFARDVLETLGADVTGSLHLDPDGRFPNHMPNPEDATAMSLTRAAVLERGADLGVVFDTDVDRSGVVDAASAGAGDINGDRLIALMSAIVLREHPGTMVVTDARASDGLTKFIETRGGRHCLYRVGYRNVIDKGVQLNEEGVETHLMMETTGHGALRENYFLDDGAYMVVKIIIEMVRMRLAGVDGGGVGSLIADLQEPAESVLLRMDVLGEPKHAKERAAQAVEAFKKYIQEDKLSGWVLDDCGDCSVDEGCLVDSNDRPIDVDAYMYRARLFDEKNQRALGMVHLRQSVHNPNIALNMQSYVPGGCKSMAKDLHERFLLASGLNEFVDISEVEKFIK